MNLQNVKSNDSAESFAERYNLSIARLKELNPDHLDVIDASEDSKTSGDLDGVTHLEVPPVVERGTIGAMTFAVFVTNTPTTLQELQRLNPDHTEDLEKWSRAVPAWEDAKKSEFFKGLVTLKVRDAVALVPFDGGDPVAAIMTKHGVTFDALKQANPRTQGDLVSMQLHNSPADAPESSFLDRYYPPVDPQVPVDPDVEPPFVDIKIFKIKVPTESNVKNSDSTKEFLIRNKLDLETLKRLNPDAKDEIERSARATDDRAKTFGQLQFSNFSIATLIVPGNSRSVAVDPNTTVDQFLAKHGVSLDVLLEANPEDPAKSKLEAAKARKQRAHLSPDGSLKLEVGGESVVAYSQNTFDQDYLDELNTTLAELKELNDRVASKIMMGRKITGGMQHLVTMKPARVLGLQIDYVNDGFEWLTYETVLNNPQFRRTNQSVRVPLYCVDMEKVEVWLREDLSDELRSVLCEAFFPDVPRHGAKIVSDYTWPWKNKFFMRAERAIAVGRRPASRHQHQVMLNPRVILPYNPYDNHAKSLAIGTTRTDDSMKQLVDGWPMPHTWRLWKTASRSCIVELKKEKDADDDWDPLVKPGPPPLHSAFDWPWSKGDAMRKLAETKATFEGEIKQQGLLKLTKVGPHHVSLKTGVCFVGSRDQSWASIKGDGKDAIDRNWIVSCLRSDFVAVTNTLMKRTNPATEPLLVLTELVTVAEKEPRQNSISTMSFRDGVQVRDLSPMHKDGSVAYVFPGSIPFLAADKKTLSKTWYEARNVRAWREFWRDAWAVSLGDAKARFLLRYGLQHKNPNPQNYLIELPVKNGELALPARIVIRDLQDAALHRETVWALYVGEGNPPPEADESVKQLLAAAFKDAAEKEAEGSTERQLARILQYEFESVAWDEIQETGSIEDSFGGPGVQVAWWSFSTGPGMNASKSAGFDAIAKESGEEALAEIKEMLGQWGMAHTIALVRRFETELGLEIRTIDWKRFPAHKRFPSKYVPSEQERRDKDNDIQIDLAAAHEIQKVLASADGRKRIVEYRQRNWEAVKEVKTWTVVDHDRKPVGWRTILFESGTDDAPVKWSRPTDGKGTMPLFEGQPVAERAWLHTYDNRISKLILEGDTWRPDQGAKLKVNFVIADGDTKKPISDPALKAIWSAAAGGSPAVDKVPTDGTVTSDVLMAGFYKVSAECGGDKPSKFGFVGATDWEAELTDGIDHEPITVEVEPLYTHVRVVAHCLATIPRQLYDGAHWKAEYVGHLVEVDDINARVDFIERAINEAASKITATEHELNLFIIPECFFLGAYGAYQAANVEYLIGNLQRLVSDAKWRHWLFVFGTINGTYGVEAGETRNIELADLFNFSPVIRGGAVAGDYDAYTKLIQKTFFCQEMPAAEALMPNLIRPAGSGRTPTADRSSEDRTSRPLTEGDVRKGFGATQNEAMLGARLDAFRQRVDLPAPLALKPIAQWALAQWTVMKVGLDAAIKTHGMTEVIREIRRHNSKNTRHTDLEFIANLANVFERHLADMRERDAAEREVPLGAVGSEHYSFGDFSFRCARKPSPLFSWDADIKARNRLRDPDEPRETSPASELPPEQILAMALEICADHSQHRAKDSKGATPVDIHLVPSAGMGLNAQFIASKDQGFAINCDGWNAVSLVLPVITGRGAAIEKIDLDPAWPPKPGINPLHPHSEMLKRSGDSFEAVKPLEVKLDIDVKKIFAYGAGHLHIYPPQKLPA